ncbi:yip1d-interacting factor 1 [Rhynchophorus ferrugineus]|uniref:Protein YIF1 n=1 Tax=Rhynchophorus ferrugineus TaxID=354439 RepID=A0A834HPE7_RHYFE|nr:hypothetical protein GWI33_021221 [Rhynchophorus ferrugineus]
MHFNANTGPRPSLGRKVKRVSDVNAMGYNPYENANSQSNIYPNVGPDIPTGVYPQDGFGTAPQYNSQNFGNIPNHVPGNNPRPNFNPQQQPYQNSFAVSANLSMLGQPVVQDMAMQYGQQLAGAGKTIIKQEMEKYVPVSKLKYYFAVDTKYVLKKLVLLFFPFTHSDWSVKYEQDGPVQPRFEINAPDLYIPSMAYITYILIAGLVLGMQDKFTPEHIGITASSALAWCVVELAVYSCTLYVIQVETSLKTLDLLAYSGYKFVGTIFSILFSLLGGKGGFYLALIYTNLALAFFLVRSLKVQVLAEHGAKDNSYYDSGHTTGHKRRLYFLLFVAAMQPLLSWWLSFHLLPTTAV